MINQIVDLDQLHFQCTSHNIGSKSVLYPSSRGGDAITQIAIGRLNVGEVIEEHVHPTMIERFVILKGACIFIIANETHLVERAQMISIGQNLGHSIIAKSDAQFIYWGESVKKQ